MKKSQKLILAGSAIIGLIGYCVYNNKKNQGKPIEIIIEEIEDYEE